MRARGVSINGLREATGLSRDTIIHYTSPETLPEKKWTQEAENYLRERYPPGEDILTLTAEVNKMLGRTDITPRAVQVRIGQLKLLRVKPNNDAKGDASREYWQKWRSGEVADNPRCPPPDDRSQG